MKKTVMSFDSTNFMDLAKKRKKKKPKKNPLYYKKIRLLRCANKNKAKKDKLIEVRRCLGQRAFVDATDEDGNTALHLVVRRQGTSTTIVKLLLKRGANVNAQNKYHRTPLHNVVSFRKTELLIKEGANMNARDTFGKTPLMFATTRCQASVVKLLLNRGADVNARDEDKYTPLNVAVRLGCTRIVKLLLNKGADVNGQGQDGNRVLYQAVLLGNTLIVELLLNKGAGVNVQTNDGDWPLHEAVRQKNESIVKLLLNKDADVNAKIRGEETSLHLAIRQYGSITDDTAIIELLLNKGADVNLYTEDGETPLQQAVRSRSTFIVKLLLNNEADVYAKTRSGYTTLHVAANTQQTAIMELLLSKITDVYAKIRGDDTPLHLAVRFGKPFIVEMLLNKGADVNAQKADGYTLLHEAARSGKMPVVDLLLNKGAKVNVKTTYGNTPLHEAARSLEASIVKLLLDKGASVNEQTTNGYTPLHVVLFCLQNYMAESLLNIDADVNVQIRNRNPLVNFAAYFEPKSVLELLINKGADVNVQGENGYTLLHYAARWGEKSAVELLLNNGADVNLRTDNGYTVLHYAARSGVISVIELLLNNGADVNAQSIDGYTPLHGAAASGILSVNELLLNKGAYVKAQTTAGQTPLHEAVRSGDRSVVELLLNKNADVNAKGEVRGTPLQEAVRSGKNSIVELLLNCSADVNAQDRFGNTALHKAVHYKKTSVVEFLLYKGADVNAQDKSGDTPLHEVALFKEYSLVELLLNKCANVNARNENGETPLHNAAYSGDTTIVELLLLKQEANVNALSKTGDTPLHRAVHSDELDMVKLLLKNGANVNVKNLNGNTPLHEAVRREKLSMATLLVDHGADVLLRNKADDTPLSIALLFVFKDDQRLVWLLKEAEKKANDKVKPLEKNCDSALEKNCGSQKPSDIFQSIDQDMILKQRLRNGSVMYIKTTDNCGLPGQLYETKLLSLIFIRVLNHEQIEHDFFLGVNVNDIGAMDDICLRCRVKGHQRPIVLFMQAKHREDPDTGKITENALWSDSGDFSLLKYLKSYLMIRERFRVGNEDPMFEGDFRDVDCYFVLYTSAKESLFKKKTENSERDIVLNLIKTEQNTQPDIEQSTKPFQYSYEEGDIINIINLLTEVTAEDQINRMECNMEHVKDFFSKLWIYSKQARQDEVERIVKDEINKYYNNNKDANNFKFELHSNAIFLKVHHEIQEWWKLKNKAPYLNRSNDLYKLAKTACLADVLLTIGNAMNDLKLRVDLEFNYYEQSRNPFITTSGKLNAKFCKLLTIINIEHMLLTVDMNIKNEIVKLLMSDNSNKIIQCEKAVSDRYRPHNECNRSINSSPDAISNNDQLNTEKFEYLKKDGTSEVGGTLFRMKMLCLVLLRLLNHEQIEQNPLLGTKIRGISFMNDICLRYKVKGQQRPVVLFMQLIHREDPEKGQLTIDEVWSGLGNFSLRKHFASYFEIKDQFHVGNKDPMFEGNFCDVDCYFVSYTSAKENLSKKKFEVKMSELMKRLIRTGQNLEPFQYDYNEADIDRLTKVTVLNRIVELGTRFLKSKDLNKTDVNKPNIFADKLIARYHVVMRRQVLQQCVSRPATNDYRVWEFRPEFFDSDDEYLVALKRTFVKIISSKRCEQGNIINETQRDLAAKSKLLLLKFKLPLMFGNLDMCFRGSRDKAQKRMKFVADKLMQLLKLNIDTKIIQINEDDVGPGKTIDLDIMDINGGIGSAVGNLLVFDTDTNMLKFDLENKALNKTDEQLKNASLFLKQLQDDRHMLFNEDLSVYRIKININGFPQDSFNGDDNDRRQAKDFLGKFWFYPNQAKDVEVEHILKDEISNKYSNNIRDYHNKNRNITDIISLNYCHQIQMWWMQTCESPYLSRASELFEHAEQADMYNLLQTVINYMYLSDINSIDIKMKPVDKDEKCEQVHQVFKKIAVKLFNLFDPQFNRSFDLQYGSKCFDKIKLSLRIHPKMDWVTLILLAGSSKDDITYRIFAKAGLSMRFLQSEDRFMVYEQFYNDIHSKSVTRDCLGDTYV